MQKENRTEKKQAIIWLLLIYICSVLFRYLLALATRNFPTVYIDEFLYYSLGRSIATEGSLLFFGQPATYNYIVYPLILSPVYLLFGHGTNYFRAIELWNILLMSLSVFPFYGLCNAMVQKRKTALWLTGLFMLLPCFILGEFIYSEAIIYPLFFTLMYCIYRYLKDNRIKYTIWIGILGILLYYSKPGAVLPAVLALILFAGKAARKKSGKLGIQILAGFGCLAAGFFLIKLLAEQVLGYQGALLSVYDDQVIDSKTYNMEFFYDAIAKYPYYFVLAGGIMPLAVSLWRYSGYDRENKQYYLFLVICSLVTMIGVAWVINRPEKKTILYLRYIEMYIPVLLLYNAVPSNNKQEITGRLCRIPEMICYMILVYVTVCTVVWGCTTGMCKAFESHFLISLAALLTDNVMGIANILIVFLSGMTLYLLVRKTEKQIIMKSCCILATVLAVLNNVQGYFTTGNNTSMKLEEETTEVHQRIGDQDYIHVYNHEQADFGLDINSRYNIFRIREDDFVKNMDQNRGVYIPFVPDSVRGMTAVRQTPDLDLMIIDEKIYRKIKLSNQTSSFISADNSFQVVSFKKHERMVDCVLKDTDDLTHALTVYNEEWIHCPVTIQMEIESQTEQVMKITADDHYEIPIAAGTYAYNLQFGESVAAYLFSVSDDPITINSYEIITENSID